MVILHVEVDTDAHLLLTADALDRFAAIFCLRQSWKQQTRENGDNADDDDQLNQCETALLLESSNPHKPSFSNSHHNVAQNSNPTASWSRACRFVVLKDRVRSYLQE